MLGGSAALVLAKVEEVEHWMDTRLDHTTPSDSNDDTQVTNTLTITTTTQGRGEGEAGTG